MEHLKYWWNATCGCAVFSTLADGLRGGFSRRVAPNILSLQTSCCLKPELGTPPERCNSVSRNSSTHWTTWRTFHMTDGALHAARSDRDLVDHGANAGLGFEIIQQFQSFLCFSYSSAFTDWESLAPDVSRLMSVN